jgi:hypothetical protein
LPQDGSNAPGLTTDTATAKGKKPAPCAEDSTSKNVQHSQGHTNALTANIQ